MEEIKKKWRRKRRERQKVSRRGGKEMGREGRERRWEEWKKNGTDRERTKYRREKERKGGMEEG